MTDRCEWAKVCMPGLWDAFITKLEAKAFSLDEITREGKHLRNLYSSVADHRKAFLEAVEDYFDVSLNDAKEKS